MLDAKVAESSSPEIRGSSEKLLNRRATEDAKYHRRICQCAVAFSQSIVYLAKFSGIGVRRKKYSVGLSKRLVKYEVGFTAAATFQQYVRASLDPVTNFS